LERGKTATLTAIGIGTSTQPQVLLSPAMAGQLPFTTSDYFIILLLS
jgi:hypothetical protein